MEHYSKEERLILGKKIGVTDEVYNILKKQKKHQKKSMAKIVCELVLNEYK